MTYFIILSLTILLGFLHLSHAYSFIILFIYSIILLVFLFRHLLTKSQHYIIFIILLLSRLLLVLLILPRLPKGTRVSSTWRPVINSQSCYFLFPFIFLLLCPFLQTTRHFSYRLLFFYALLMFLILAIPLLFSLILHYITFLFFITSFSHGNNSIPSPSTPLLLPPRPPNHSHSAYSFIDLIFPSYYFYSILFTSHRLRIFYLSIYSCSMSSLHSLIHFILFMRFLLSLIFHHITLSTILSASQRLRIIFS